MGIVLTRPSRQARLSGFRQEANESRGKSFVHLFKGGRGLGTESTRSKPADNSKLPKSGTKKGGAPRERSEAEPQPARPSQDVAL